MAASHRHAVLKTGSDRFWLASYRDPPDGSATYPLHQLKIGGRIVMLNMNTKSGMAENSHSLTNSGEIRAALEWCFHATLFAEANLSDAWSMHSVQSLKDFELP